MKYRLGYTLDEYKKKVESGEWQLHGFDKGFLITEVVQFAEERVLVVHLAGGEQFDTWKQQAVNRMEEFGREQGCDAVEAACRFGMARKLESLGWEPWHVIMRREL